MALRGTLTHRKTRRLARALQISPVFALGIVEALWHITAEQAPTGAIGKMSDEDIAMEMFYDGDPAALVDALVQSAFVDRDPDHRLIVHDWHIHSDDATDVKVARSTQLYANGALPRMRRLSKDERERLCAQLGELQKTVRTKCHAARTACAQNATASHEKPLPEPEPVPEPEPKPLAPAAPPPGDAEKRSAPEKKPQRVAPDERFAEFRHAIEAYWQHKNPGTPMPWDGSDARRLTEFLKACPSLELSALREMLNNRAKSDVVHTERPRAWIASLSDYAAGPLDRYRRPESHPAPAGSAVGMAPPGNADTGQIFARAVSACCAQPVDQPDSDHARYLAAEAIARFPEATAFTQKDLAADFETFLRITRNRLTHSQEVVTC